MNCLFCNSSNITHSGLPPNVFNKKNFSYLVCADCNLQFISPIPSAEDLVLMYPPSYQGKIETETFSLSNKMPGLRFSYEEQFNQIKKCCNVSQPMLDYGCGTGHFIYNLGILGYFLNGVEFSKDTVAALADAMPNHTFYTIQDFYKSPQKYALIRISNVLEHFTDPNAEFKQILDKVETGGYILLEGPLEKNNSLVNFFKWAYFKTRFFLDKNYTTSYVPTHVFFSNYSNQLTFFERMNLQTVEYKIKENAWPYPENIKQIKSATDLIKYFVGKMSICLSYFNKKYGNTFLYLGRKN